MPSLNLSPLPSLKPSSLSSSPSSNVSSDPTLVRSQSPSRIAFFTERPGNPLGLQIPTINPSTSHPMISVIPSVSATPTYASPIHHSLEPSVSCIEDGSFGLTKGMRGIEISFVYAIRSKNGTMSRESVPQFEEELNVRIACNYRIPDSCLECEDGDDDESVARRRMDANTFVGLSQFPSDDAALERKQYIGLICVFYFIANVWLCVIFFSLLAIHDVLL